MNAHRVVLLTAVAALLVTGPLEAHHSRAEFDLTNDVTFVGVVKRFEWTNPHTYLYIDVSDDQGKTTELSIEFAAVGQLIRAGWTPQSFKPGDKVKALGNAAKDSATKKILMKMIFGYAASGSEVRLPAQAAPASGP